MLVFLGTNGSADYFWTGGSFLRYDWFFCLIASLCFLQRGYPFVAGALISYAASLRIFPLIALLGPALLIAQGMIHRRSFRLQPEEWNFVKGGLLSACIISILALTVSGHATTVFQDFYSNTQKHLATPLTNHMGLKTVLSSSWDTRARIIRDPSADEPYLYWKHERQQTFGERKFLHVILLGIFTVALYFAVRHRTLSQSLILGVGAIPFLVELTCYYYSFMASWGALSSLIPAFAPLIMVAAWLTWEVRHWLTWYDDLYVVQSLIFLVTILIGYLVAALQPSARSNKE
jgi:hypothetical protein